MIRFRRSCGLCTRTRKHVVLSQSSITKSWKGTSMLATARHERTWSRSDWLRSTSSIQSTPTCVLWFTILVWKTGLISQTTLCANEKPFTCGTMSTGTLQISLIGQITFRAQLHWILGPSTPAQVPRTWQAPSTVATECKRSTITWKWKTSAHSSAWRSASHSMGLLGLRDFEFQVRIQEAARDLLLHHRPVTLPTIPRAFLLLIRH